MELAVCLSKYAGEKEAFKYFEEFVDGFAQHGVLTEQEIKVIPDLINLRVLSNVVYFVGRALAKEDGIESLTTRAATYATRVEWINSKSDDIVALISKKMLKQ
jgi:Ser/Thr protein kinase RdoA (MazF antagonist)